MMTAMTIDLRQSVERTVHGGFWFFLKNRECCVLELFVAPRADDQGELAPLLGFASGSVLRVVRKAIRRGGLI